LWLYLNVQTPLLFFTKCQSDHHQCLLLTKAIAVGLLYLPAPVGLFHHHRAAGEHHLQDITTVGMDLLEGILLPREAILLRKEAILAQK
jgi:hypothetical protein